MLAGGASTPFFRDTAHRIVTMLPDGTLSVLEGQDHDAPPEVVSPPVAAFLAA